MRECGPSRDENGAHERVFVVVAVQTARVVYLALLLAFFDVEFALGNDSPAGLGDEP
jgi:hypothetical protein